MKRTFQSTGKTSKTIFLVAFLLLGTNFALPRKREFTAADRHKVKNLEDPHVAPVGK